MKNKEQTVSGWNLFRSSRKLISCIVAILLVMQLVSCSKTNKKDTSTVEDDGYRIYYINKNSTGLVYDSYKTDTKDTALLLEELLQRMGTDSKKYGAKKVLGETILVKETTISDNQLSLNFDSNYTNQPKINEVLTRAAIVMTVTQIPGIDDVEFTVSGQPLMDSYEKPIGLMSASDFIDTTDVGLNYVQTEITVYFPNKKGNKLVAITQPVSYDGAITMEQLVVQCLMDGPKALNPSLQESIPSGTVLNSVSTIEGVCYVDFSSEFVDNKISTITDEVAIYSVVNSLVEVSSINKVKFMIDGVEKATFRESIPFDSLFVRDLDIIEGSK